VFLQEAIRAPEQHAFCVNAGRCCEQTRKGKAARIFPIEPYRIVPKKARI
jgi:hypothetical protein